MGKDFTADARAATRKISQLAKLAGETETPSPAGVERPGAKPLASPANEVTPVAETPGPPRAAKRPKVKTRHISLTCTPEMDDSLRLLARRDGRPVNAIVEEAVAKLLAERDQDIQSFIKMLNG